MPTPRHLLPEFQQFLARARAPRLRRMREFAEQEITIPDGPFSGRRFRCDRQPYTGLWFDAIDSGRWNRYVATGPTQSGKTLSCFVIPTLYHLLELGETVLCGLPDMDMAADKWRESLLPVIEQSRYRDLLPRHGGGSRGGKVEAVQFRHGPTLKFMSGGGGDKSRAGFTSRVLIVTETDGLDQAGGNSREADKLTQLEARTRAYGSRKRVYLECTVSTEKGRTWQEYQQGTCSKIVLPCPKCEEWVTPERANLVGWQGAANLTEARQRAEFQCPACAASWSDVDRATANSKAVLVHRDQELDPDGQITGPAPATDTLGFRWSAVHNLFVKPGDIGADEWKAGRRHDEEQAEKELRQFVWCLPALPAKWNPMALDEEVLLTRTSIWRRGLVPPDTQYLTLGMDLGKYLIHWVLVAWEQDARSHVVDYGRLEVPSRENGVEMGLLLALREFRELIETGWPQAGTGLPNRIPDQIWLDAGYQIEVVNTFCQESGRGYMPCVGRGAGQQREQWLQRTTRSGSVVEEVGSGYHISSMPGDGYLAEIDVDRWKTWVQQRLIGPMTAPGAMTFYEARPAEHMSLVKHLTSEQEVEEFVAGKGLVRRWERIRRQNHWLDALNYASVAAYVCGLRLLAENVVDEPVRPLVVHTEKRPDGREWIDVDV